MMVVDDNSPTYFIGIMIPEKIRKKIKSIQPKGDHSYRLSPEAKFHITLSYIGRKLPVGLAFALKDETAHNI